MCLSLVAHAVEILVSQIDFSPLQVKNKPHDRDMKHTFILRPSSMVPNIVVLVVSHCKSFNDLNPCSCL
jgi:hypothetical protein